MAILEPFESINILHFQLRGCITSNYSSIVGNEQRESKMYLLVLRREQISTSKWRQVTNIDRTSMNKKLR